MPVRLVDLAGVVAGPGQVAGGELERRGWNRLTHCVEWARGAKRCARPNRDVFGSARIDAAKSGVGAGSGVSRRPSVENRCCAVYAVSRITTQTV